MDWKKLAEEAKNLEETKAEEAKAAQEPPPPKLVAGDVILHPALGRCYFAGDRGNGTFFVRGPDGRTVQLAHKLVRISAVDGQPRTYTITLKKT